jgi:hypothetical protein
MAIDYVRDAEGGLRRVRVDRIEASKSERSDPEPRASRAGAVGRMLFRPRAPGSYVLHLPASVRAVGERIANEHGITFAAMAGRSRYPRCVRARHRWWTVVKWSLALSYPETGALFGVDHTTVMNAVDHVEDDLEREYERAAASSGDGRGAETEEEERGREG